MEELRKIIEKRRKKIERSVGDIPESMKISARGGRTWKQIAQDFCRNMLKLFRDNNTDHWVYPGNVIRDLVGDPDNSAFRKHCGEYGIRITKTSYSNSYNVQQIKPRTKK